MSHTPGPWTAHRWGDADYEINAANDNTVCNVPGFDDHTVDRDRAGADAYLIAAAPEMLAALEACVADADATGCDGCAVVSAAVIERLEQVIAKAKQNPAAEKTWEFTFQVVQTAETRADALEAAYAYLAEHAAKNNLEPVKDREI